MTSHFTTPTIPAGAYDDPRREPALSTHQPTLESNPRFLHPDSLRHALSEPHSNKPNPYRSIASPVSPRGRAEHTNGHTDTPRIASAPCSAPTPITRNSICNTAINY